jgi:prefoldin subunit 5
LFIAARSPKKVEFSSSTVVSPSVGSQVVSIDEREKDLSFLQKKIEELKLDLEDFGKSIDSCQNDVF